MSLSHYQQKPAGMHHWPWRHRMMEEANTCRLLRVHLTHCVDAQQPSTIWRFSIRLMLCKCLLVEMKHIDPSTYTSNNRMISNSTCFTSTAVINGVDSSFKVISSLLKDTCHALDSQFWQDTLAIFQTQCNTCSSTQLYHRLAMNLSFRAVHTCAWSWSKISVARWWYPRSASTYSMH